MQKNGFMKKFFFLLLFFSHFSLYASEESPAESKTIYVQNTILAKIKDTTISLLDVKKKMDLLFHRSYPHLKNSSQARYQFYMGNWRSILSQMIDTELILADAATKELKISDGEIREEMQKHFGPNVLFTLFDLGITYEEAWKITKTDMIVKKMTGYYVSNKAFASVTPQEIRLAYQEYCDKNPSLDEWQYHLVTIKAAAEEIEKKAAEKAHALLTASKADPISLSSALKEIEKSEQGVTIQVSQLYKANRKELSSAHLAILQQLSTGAYSAPLFQTSRSDGKKLYRIFYLKEATKKEVPSFEKMADQLQDELFHVAAEKEYTRYCQKLRLRYGYDPSLELKNLKEDFQPFILR